MSCPNKAKAKARAAQAEPGAAQSKACSAQVTAASAQVTAGFTLLELLISIALLSIVMVLIYGAISQVTSGITSLNAELANQQETRLLLRMITDDLQAVNYFERFVKSAGAKSGIIVSRESFGTKFYSKTYFHANVPSRFHRRVDRKSDPLMHELAYWVEASEEDRELMVLKRREDFYLDDDMEEGGISVDLTEGIETFRIELLGEAEQSASLEGDWVDEWDSNEGKKGALPVAIRVTLALAAPPGAEIREETLDINIESSLGGNKP